jgi:hypothetical protein
MPRELRSVIVAAHAIPEASNVGALEDRRSNGHVAC